MRISLVALACGVLGCHGGAAVAPDSDLDGRPADAALDAGIAVATGSADPTFGSGGLIDMDFGGVDTPDGAVLLPSGRILVAVRSDSPTTTTAQLVAFTQDGVVDTGYGSGGYVALDIVGEIIGAAGDGSIYVGALPASPLDALEVEHRLADGSLDMAYGTAGHAVAGFDLGTPVALEYANGTSAVDSSGRIYVTGRTASTDSEDTTGQVIVSRLTAAGGQDFTFGGYGSVLLHEGRPMNIAIQSDGRPLVSLYGTNVGDTVVERLTEAGSLDPTYGSNGLGYFLHNDGPDCGIAVDSADNAVIAGTVALTTSFGGRLTTAGQPDPTFGGGYIPLPVDGTCNRGSVAVRAAGGLLASATPLSSPSTAEVLAVDATATHATLYHTVTSGSPDWFVVLELPDADLFAIGRSAFTGATSDDLLLGRFLP